MYAGKAALSVYPTVGGSHLRYIIDDVIRGKRVSGIAPRGPAIRELRDQAGVHLAAKLKGGKGKSEGMGQGKKGQYCRGR